MSRPPCAALLPPRLEPCSTLNPPPPFRPWLLWVVQGHLVSINIFTPTFLPHAPNPAPVQAREILINTVHLFISDWSISIIEPHFATQYAGSPLLPLEIHRGPLDVDCSRHTQKAAHIHLSSNSSSSFQCPLTASPGSWLPVCRYKWVRTPHQSRHPVVSSHFECPLRLLHREDGIHASYLPPAAVIFVDSLYGRVARRYHRADHFARSGMEDGVAY